MGHNYKRPLSVPARLLGWTWRSASGLELPLIEVSRFRGLKSDLYLYSRNWAQHTGLIDTISQSRLNRLLIGSLSPGKKKSSGLQKLIEVHGKCRLEKSSVSREDLTFFQASLPRSICLQQVWICLLLAIEDLQAIPRDPWSSSLQHR